MTKVEKLQTAQAKCNAKFAKKIAAAKEVENKKAQKVAAKASKKAAKAAKKGKTTTTKPTLKSF